MKRELSVEVSTSTQKDGEASKNAWPGLDFTKMWSYLLMICNIDIIYDDILADKRLE